LRIRRRRLASATTFLMLRFMVPFWRHIR
jgi:hypothetical protein